MRQHKLIFGDVDTSTFGVWLTGSGTFSAPTRDVEYISVPGRNGDLIIDNGKWNNIDVTYPANIPPLVDMDSKLAGLRAALCRHVGYVRLEDTYHPDEYRRAAFTSGLEPVPSPDNKGADFNLVFSCKPQRFLKSGDTPIKLLPIYPIGQTKAWSQYIPIGSEEFAVAFKCGEGVSVTLNLYTYDAGGNIVHSYSEEAVNGQETHYAFTSPEVSLRFQLEDLPDLDSWTLTVVEGETVFEPVAGIEEDVDLTGAVFCRHMEIDNPTGYAAKPLIEFFRTTINSFAITNKTDGGVDEEYYLFNVANTSKQHYYMDCDIQYLYDDALTNLTNYLTMTTSQSAIGKALVFPELGANKIVIDTYYTGSDDNGCGLVRIYPRWWKL